MESVEYGLVLPKNSMERLLLMVWRLIDLPRLLVCLSYSKRPTRTLLCQRRRTMMISVMTAMPYQKKRLRLTYGSMVLDLRYRLKTETSLLTFLDALRSVLVL